MEIVYDGKRTNPGFVNFLTLIVQGKNGYVRQSIAYFSMC